ncbi:MAG: aldo/keto reductase [Pirellulaceae bacterium]|nr:aldo/keto reductase [Pirellulaceae bacterium]
MSHENHLHLSRRSFVRRTGLLAGGALVSGQATAPMVMAQAAPTAVATDVKPWPTRVLGKTGVPVTTMTLGTAPCGLSPKIPPREIADIVNEALDLGINSIDTAPAYKQSEEGIGLALGKRRKEVFLATKVMADTIEDAEKSLSKSFELLKTDWVDLVYYHSVGDRDIEAGVKPDGVFSWLIKQKQAGKCRFVGISGHNRPAKFVPLLETGEVDVLLAIVNFVDRFTYGFEHKVFPLARNKNVPIVAMKVFGGAKQMKYEDPEAPPQMDVEHLEMAIRFALGTPGVTTLNLGVHNCQQLRQNVEAVKRYEPLTGDQQDRLRALGKSLAQEWGAHFGPVV